MNCLLLYMDMEVTLHQYLLELIIPGFFCTNDLFRFAGYIVYGTGRGDKLGNARENPSLVI